MYICICNAVTDKDIKQAFANGVCSMRGLRQQLGVASNCGTCAKYAKTILDNEIKKKHYN